MSTAPPIELGWDDELDAAWEALGRGPTPGRVCRIDRGWSTVVTSAAQAGASDGGGGDPAHRWWGFHRQRVRNIGADVAVGDWVVIDDERVHEVLPRKSAFVRRASFDGMRAEADTLAANVDIVFLVHSVAAPPNRRRLERELVLAFDSGAQPVIVLTKSDLAAATEPVEDELAAVSGDVPVLLTSGVTGEGIGGLAEYAAGHRTLALLGSSGVGKSTLVNVLLGSDVQAVSDVRPGDQRGRHTTVATELLPLPEEGWLIDTPGFRAVSLWLSGEGIERAFVDVFDLMDHCRFRDCKHDQEPGCAVRAAIDQGELDPARWASLERLVAEEAAIEDEQRARERLSDRRQGPRV